MSDETFLMKPKVDFCFKELMEDAEIRRGFISALLGVKPDEIEGTELLPTHLRREHEEDKLEIHILELPKLKERNYPETEVLNWARFFNAEHKEEFEMAAEASPYIERAYERLTQLSGDEMKRLEYEAREKAIRDHNYLMKYNLELGMKKGMEEGRKKGLEEGLEEGKKEGRREGIEQGAKALIEICQSSSFSKEDTLTGLIEKLSISKDEAEQYLKRYWRLES
ncbi:MAG: hypothetical protein HFI19_07440 [Lachnospiraceae bacterium]|nr:hypothetical protein [Lachnospiraceae bacterium]